MLYDMRMTMLSFRIGTEDASAIRRWAEELGVERSELLRDAVRRHLTLLASEHDIDAWSATPPTAEEQSLGEAADWGPTEDWTDWADAEG